MRVLQNTLMWVGCATSLLALSVNYVPFVIAASSGSGVAISTGNTTNTNTSVASPDMRYDGWIYPDAPNVMPALQQVGYIHGLRAEFMHINDDGTVEQINQDAEHPYGYSPEFAQTLRNHAGHRYITISGSIDGTTLAMRNPQTVDQIVNFANQLSFGVELDWEDYGQWTPEYYQQYKTFVGTLRDHLHDIRHTLIVDGPPIPDESAQQWYQWKYEDIAPLTDRVTMMVYDNQYDTGAGNSIAPRDWTKQCMQWLRDKAGDKGVVGLAAYGYKADTNTGRITVGPSSFISRQATNLSVTRNADGELTATDGTNFYDYSDTQTLKERVRQAQDMGISRVSIWSLGDNPWL